MPYHRGYVYIVSNKSRTTYYVGVTNSLARRSHEHKYKNGSKFTTKYKCHDLIYYECFDSIVAAIKREKVLKKWKRDWKDELIKKLNPEMRDLYDEVRDMR